MADDGQALNEAEAMAEPFEGFRAAPYQDPVGVWTIGFGTTRDTEGAPVSAVTPPVTLDQARRLMLRDMRGALMGVKGDVKVPLSTDEEAALIDFSYNLGLGNLGASTLLRLLNQGDYAGAAGQFDLWDRAGGKVLAGLLRRRAAEKTLFERGMLSDAEGAPSSAPAAVPSTSPAAPGAGGFLGWLGRLFS